MMSNSATKPFLLWLDLTHDRSVADLIALFRATCECRLAEAAAMPQRASAQQPDMICMHFDRPDALGLNLLLEVKRSVPSIPITMFTVQHSEELAVWAMRSRVWEYMVLPLNAAEKNRYLRSLMQLCELRRSAASQGKKPLVERYPSVPDSIRMTAEHQKHQALNKVLQHIDEHFRENIDQKALAQGIYRRINLVQRFERLVKPRLKLFCTRPFLRVMGIVGTLCAVVLSLPIPLMNFPPTLAVFLMALGVLTRDGAMVLAGILLAVLLLGGLVVVAIFIPDALAELWSLLGFGSDGGSG